MLGICLIILCLQVSVPIDLFNTPIITKSMTTKKIGRLNSNSSSLEPLREFSWIFFSCSSLSSVTLSISLYLSALMALISIFSITNFDLFKIYNHFSYRPLSLSESDTKFETSKSTAASFA